MQLFQLWWWVIDRFHQCMMGMTEAEWKIQWLRRMEFRLVSIWTLEFWNFFHLSFTKILLVNKLYISYMLHIDMAHIICTIMKSQSHCGGSNFEISGPISPLDYPQGRAHFRLPKRLRIVPLVLRLIERNCLHCLHLPKKTILKYSLIFIRSGT